MKLQPPMSIAAVVQAVLRPISAAVVCCAACLVQPHACVAQHGATVRGFAQPDPDQVKQKLRAILSRPEFAERPQHASDLARRIQEYAERIETTWHELARFLDKWYNRIKELFNFSGGTIRATSRIFVGTFIAACGLLAVYLLKRYLIAIADARDRVSRSSPNSYSLSGTDLDTALGRTAEEWLTEAKLLSDQSNYRAAVRARFLAVLVQLHVLGLLEHLKADTNNNHLIFLASRITGDIPEAFQRLVLDFDFIWYGEHSADEADDDRSKLDTTVITSALTVNHQQLARKARPVVA